MTSLGQFPLLQLWLRMPFSAAVRSLLMRIPHAILWMAGHVIVGPLGMTSTQARPLLRHERNIIRALYGSIRPLKAAVLRRAAPALQRAAAQEFQRCSTAGPFQTTANAITI